MTDSRIAKWQDWLDNRIRPDLVTVCAYRDTFNEVVRIAAENSSEFELTSAEQSTASAANGSASWRVVCIGR